MLEILVLSVCLDSSMTDCKITKESQPVNHNRCEWMAIKLENKLINDGVLYYNKPKCKPENEVDL